MKKIILSVVVIVVVILGILYITGRIVLNNQPNSSGWDRKVLKGDELEAFFPRTLGTDLYYIGPYQGGKFDALDPMGDIKYKTNIIEKELKSYDSEPGIELEKLEYNNH